jgi:archaeosine synthase beta-subunit
MSLSHLSYLHTGRERDAWVLSRRGARNAVTPDRPYAFLEEMEPDAAGELIRTGTIFLTNKECPFRCVMCDLWKNTLPTATPPGAVPAQIEFAVSHWPAVQQLKLYNSGSFFDPHAIPPEDIGAIADLVRHYQRIIVECHPAFIGRACADFAGELDGKLEVAVGLESSNPDVLRSLNKRMTLDLFRRSADFLGDHKIDLRVFVLIAPPFLPLAEAVESTKDSIEFAFDAGAKVVSLIPTRGGNGAMEQLTREGLFDPPSLTLIEKAFATALKLSRGRVFLDLWDIETFAHCTSCIKERSERLRQMNLKQQILPAVHCHECRTF